MKQTHIKVIQGAVVFSFVALFAWWIDLFFVNGSRLSHDNLVWAALYQIVALIGAVYGIFISRTWGGVKSMLGRAILMISIGLLMQNIGQTVFSYYNLVLQNPTPYPSIADIGFFGSIIFYIYGMVLFGKVCGTHLSLQTYTNKAIAFIVPAILLACSYFMFLKGYQFDFSNPVKVFLDYGYPIGQAFYISLALLVFILSKDSLGGIMRNSILLILLSFLVQYISDFNFLYQSSVGTWVNGGYGDFLYLTSYTIMAFAIMKFGLIGSALKDEKVIFPQESTK